jgi:5-methylcytosine-specific restriction endonuclease McrA
MLCGATERIVVDHIKPRRKFPELELDLDNLQVLCNDCNMGKSNDDYTDFRPKDGLTPEERAEMAILESAMDRIH